MAGQRQPLNLVLAKGKKHLTKAEIEERERSEVQPCTDGIAAPSYLTARQKKEFKKIADQLQRIGIMGETDNDALARYITAQDLYEQAVKDLRRLQKERPKDAGPDDLVLWAELMEKLDKRVERYAKQAHSTAAALGLSITSRCKLALPPSAEAPKENKFAKFGGAKVAGAE